MLGSKAVSSNMVSSRTVNRTVSRTGGQHDDAQVGDGRNGGTVISRTVARGIGTDGRR